MQVFNGLAALSPDEAMAATQAGAESELRPSAATGQTAMSPEPAQEQAIPVPSTPEPPPEIFGEEVVQSPQSPDVAGLTPEPEGLTDADAVPITAAEEPASEELPSEDNPFLLEATPPKPASPHRLLWTTGSLLLVIALTAQAVYFYRGEIAARNAQAREWLDLACARAGCTVELPQRTKSLLIEASDLQLIDPARPERIQLTATLRNHAAYSVAFPALDLVLTNINDHTLARRIFLPHEYLGNGRDQRPGIAANAEVTVRLDLETSNLGAAGFRLAVLPAPTR